MTTTIPKVHPWSEGFEWEDHTGPFRLVTAPQAAAYDRDGFFVLEDVVPPATIEEVVSAIDPLEERTTEQLRQKGGREVISDADAITFSTHLVTQDERLGAFALSGLFQDLCSDLIGPDVRLYWDQAVYKKPEPVREFPWHQDNGYTFIRPEAYLTCWIPLVDATVDNGCPWVVPGLHRLGTLRHEWTDVGFQCLDTPADAVPVPARAGSIVVFSSLTPHRTGPNTTDAVRKSYILQYSPTDAVILQGSPKEEPQTAGLDQDPWRPELLAGGRSAR